MQNLDTSGAKIIPTPVRINETAQEKCKDNTEPGHRVKSDKFYELKHEQPDFGSHYYVYICCAHSKSYLNL